MLYTTFDMLHKAGACRSRYKVLAKNLGGVREYGKNTPISLRDIFESNGLEDTLWALDNACPDSKRFARLLACDYAEHVLPIYEYTFPNDDTLRRAIDTSRRFANGEAFYDELNEIFYKTIRASFFDPKDMYMFAARDVVITVKEAIKPKVSVEAVAISALHPHVYFSQQDLQEERQWQVDHLSDMLMDLELMEEE